ncbi:unnamed protein product [Onchocerca flexuosa]|uniref:Secreted protein n=1 Tax=Onchocerca flexuosa TaxID=387005 RepID=A0A183H976_9BILA|nr:unnamed protein product [Onchocerca flexuosa]
MTIPRLELLAILIQVRAAHFMIKQLELESKAITYSPIPTPTMPFTRSKKPFQTLTDSYKTVSKKYGKQNFCSDTFQTGIILLIL